MTNDPNESRQEHSPLPTDESPATSRPGPQSGGGDFFSQQRVVYILYAASLVFPVTQLLGLVMAYLARGEATPTLASHYTFLIRTFWIGLLFGVIGVALTMIGIGFLVLLVVVVWFVIRIVKGWMLMEKGKPIAQPTSWLFG